MQTQVYSLQTLTVCFSLTRIHMLSLFYHVFSHGDNYGTLLKRWSDRQLVSLAWISPDGIWKLAITFWELKLVEVNYSTLSDRNFSVNDWTLFSVSTEQKKIKKHCCVFSTLKLSSVINYLPLHKTDVLKQRMVLFFQFSIEIVSLNWKIKSYLALKLIWLGSVTYSIAHSRNFGCISNLQASINFNRVKLRR